MTDVKHSSVYDRRSLFVWAFFCLLAGIIFLAYALTSLAMGRGVFVMPLDDVYIHFQYAKQMALGQPYVYNPGLPPTSGATSFLYTYMLAVGYLLGFQGLNLGLWAMLLGMVALVCSTWLVYRLVKIFDAPEWLAILSGVVFAINGPVSWHFMSGMETGWVVLFALGTLDSVMRIACIPPGVQNPRLTEKPGSPLKGLEDSAFSASLLLRRSIVFGTLIALIRPEGGMLAGLAMVALFLMMWRRSGRRHVVPLLIPILVIGVQPLVNLALTGSAVASGNAAKSVFGTIPFYWDAVIARSLSNWAQLWIEFFTGSSPREGLYIAPLMLVVAIIGLLALLRKRESRVIGLMLLGWLAFGTLAISTLDTAFWHFKRYQMPFMALLFPLVGWGTATLWGRSDNQAANTSQQNTPILIRLFAFLTSLRDPVVELFVPRRRDEAVAFSVKPLMRGIVLIAMLFAIGVSLFTSARFLWNYGLNVNYVYQQPLQMARWLEGNTPPDAVIAVHDVGMMRYLGGRTTLDMVGLTTPGAADYWRNGPGSVAEFLIEKRPDYIASYGVGHGFGLGMLADTRLYGEPLASFPVDLDPNYNVALAVNFQGIYKPDWETIVPVEQAPKQTSSIYAQGSFQRGDGRHLLDSINVANIESERAHHYEWHNVEGTVGFPSVVHDLSYVDPLAQGAVIDGGRLINGVESFQIKTQNWGLSVEQALLLISRVESTGGGTIDVYADDYLVATRWLPALPGQWIEIPTLIPFVFTTSDTVNIRIEAHGDYMPYYHFAYQGLYDPGDTMEFGFFPTVTTFQDGAIELYAAEITDVPTDTFRYFTVLLEWQTYGDAKGDYKLFIHVLDKDGNIVAQTDRYPYHGALPPGDWVRGNLGEHVLVDTTGVPPGKYRVAIGLYNPYTFERLQPAGGDDQNRFFIGEVEIK